MAHDLTPLKSYVGFYQTVITQLVSAWTTLGRTHEAMRTTLAPFGEVLAPVQSAALAAATGAGTPSPSALTELWRPEDPANLEGICDLYEVVGRFAFQGDENTNLRRIQMLVSTARNEVHLQRARLTDLAGLSVAARASADRLELDATRRADQLRGEKLAQFTPLAQAAVQRAKQTSSALREVPLPELDNVEIAADEYRRYVAKVDNVYKTCLPFLKKSIAALCEFAGCTVDASWPETLPLIREMPAELLAVPQANSPELSQAQSGMSSLGEEETLLNRARDEIALTIVRLEGEVAAHRAKEAEATNDAAPARALLEYATGFEQLESARLALASLEQQKAQRVYVIGEAWKRVQQTEAAIKALDEELVNRYQEMAQKNDQLAREVEDEPRLFGKEDWRLRVAGMQGELESLKTKYTERVNLLNQLKMDLRTLSVQAQTEQSQAETIDRWMADAKVKLQKHTDAVKDIEKKLGAARPPRAPTSIEAQQSLDLLEVRRLEIVERIDRFEAEKRRQKEELERVTARFKQIQSERQRAEGMLHDAQTAATLGVEAARKQVAARRRSAVEQHVTEILDSLDQSMASVEAMFVEPAREAMLKSVAASTETAVAVREGADKIAPLIETLSRELEPELLAQDATLGQVQREFCDAAEEACHAAWA